MILAFVMKMSPFSFVRRCLHASLLTAWLLACGTASAAERPLRVAASFSILADLVTQVGGPRIQVQSLVGPEQDAHVFRPRPSDVAQLREAALIVMNGAGFDPWMTRLIESSETRAPVLVLTRGLALRAAEDEAFGQKQEAREHEHEHEHEHDQHHEREHGHGDAHHGDAYGGMHEADSGARTERPSERTRADAHLHGPIDPHAWQDPRNVVAMVNEIVQALAQVDPDHADEYRQRADEYIGNLQALDAEIERELARIPAEQRRVITSHAAMAYFGARYGIEFIGAQGLSTASEPSAGEIAALVRQARQGGIRAVFFEGVSSSSLLEQVAREAGLSLGGRLYTDTLSTAEGPAPTYIDMMRHNTISLVKALVPQ